MSHQVSNALEDVAAASDHLVRLSQIECSDASRFHDVAAAMHGVCARIAEAERRGCETAAIRVASASARDAHSQSPFVHRLQSWPRGYPGDFETIEYLLSQKVRAQRGTAGYWIEYYALGTSIAQQHRNKVTAQAREIRQALTSGASRVLVIAAGSSPDLALVAGLLRDRPCQVVLNDGDAEALAYSLDRLSSVQHRLQAVPGNALRSVARLAPYGPFDLVLAGGLFDYLTDRAAELLIRGVWEQLLAPGGRFFFTNLAHQNPNRIWMEYMADWRLIERSASELKDLVVRCCGAGAAIQAEADATGLAWLVSVDKTSNTLGDSSAPTTKAD